MDFSYSEEQTALRELARRLFAERFTDAFRKTFARGGLNYDATLWGALAEAGVLGTAIGADQGGSGLGLTELLLVLEEQGRTLAAVPTFATLVLGALPLERFGNAAQRALLPQVARGELLFSAALEEPGNAQLLAPATLAQPVTGGWRISGLKSCVPYALDVQCLLVSASTPDAVARLFLIDPRAPGVELRAQQSTSGEPQGEVRLAGVLAGPADLLGTDARPLRYLVECAQVALASWQLGVLEEAVRRAAAYVCERQQFGRPIGSFQAVQHRLADCYIDLEALRSAYLAAVWALDAGRNAPGEVRCAKWWAAYAGHRVSHAVQHVHGGLGADVEYPVQAFFLQAKQLEVALGGATPTLAAIGAALACGAVPAFTTESERR
jgi:alkylation response protein AidB-like acyl-CoA dehydrogenase